MLNRVAQHMLMRRTSSASATRARILSLKDDIAQTLAADYSVMDVFSLLQYEGTVDCSYQTFRRYVIALVISPGSEAEVIAEKPKAARLGNVKLSKQSITNSDNGKIPTFQWNPVPNPDELF